MIDLKNIKVDLPSVTYTPKSLTVSVGRPNPQVHFRVLEQETLPLIALVKWSDEAKYYLVDRSLTHVLADDVRFYKPYFCYTSQDQFHIWPVLELQANKRPNPWILSAHQAASLACTHWVRLISDVEAGRYKCHEAQNYECFPAVPETFDPQELITLGFKDFYITDENHEIIQRLRGLSR